MKHTARVLIKLGLYNMFSYICWRHSYLQHTYCILTSGTKLLCLVWKNISTESHRTSVH